MQPSRRERALLQCIPKDPPGCGYAEAYKLGLIPPSLQKTGKESGKAYRRIKEAGLVPTITTSLSIQDSRNGASTHWSQDRPITILDARRAQGLPDYEPIIGNLAAQYKIIGNGVDRHVAFALGLAIRDAVSNTRQRHGAIEPIRTPILDMIVDAERDEDRFSEIAALSSVEDNESDVEMTYIPGLDGSSDIRDGALTSLPSNTTSFLSRMSTTIDSSIKGWVHRSKYYPVPKTTKSTPSKRSHDEFANGSNQGSAFHGDDQATARKEPRLVDTEGITTGPTMGVEVEKSETARQSSRIGTKTRYTRHSGLEVTFTPRRWNRKPERENLTAN